MRFMITFNHVEGEWERLSDAQRKEHGSWLADFIADLKEQKNAELVFLAPWPGKNRGLRRRTGGVGPFRENERARRLRLRRWLP